MISFKKGYKSYRPRQGESQRLQILLSGSSSGMLPITSSSDPPVECWRDVTGQKDPSQENPTPTSSDPPVECWRDVTGQ
ncbi:unnamed protein product [Rodentolepis nana]|uniref:Uncharacterized protein n=1 Tax=Rodentolepis nana TaxID=102285 RepID=A0A0R3TA21_RODNA|nr:unnamed protein product [Rodentolepis nana]